MLFNSFEFFVFFPAVVVLYFILPYRFRWLLLLAASYFFYMWWKVEYAILLVVSTVVDFVVSHQMAKCETKRQKKKWLWASIFTNIGILFFFKYFNFFNGALRDLFVAQGTEYSIGALEVLLPMGISFYTFQTLSYTIDVYNGRILPAKHFGKFALFVTFFPQLVAGPIERAKHLLPQFDKTFDFEYARVVTGLKQMLWGFFKKLVIADRVAVMVNLVYNDAGAYDLPTTLLVLYLFAFQIYCDFSGYSDIAIGAARVMGYDIMQNFRVPYLSASIREFWSRWHISLSTWFRDYLYIPLGGNRVVKWRWYYNLFIVFVVSGLWHGANWTFILWGALHGGYLVLALLFKGFFDSLHARTGLRTNANWYKWLNVLVTFHLVLFGWHFFRANNVGEAVQMLQLPTHQVLGFTDLLDQVKLGIGLTTIALCACFVFIDPFIDKVCKGEKRFGNRPVEFLFYASVLAITLLFGHFGEAEFIYFQF